MNIHVVYIDDSSSVYRMLHYNCNYNELLLVSMRSRKQFSKSERYVTTIAQYTFWGK